jgi:group I intron endonuclease
MVVYKTTNLINGKQYIGRDMYNNPKYLGSGKLLVKAIEKYGMTNFQKEILQECTSIDELKLAEEYWIKYYNAASDPNFYNILNSSTGGDSLSNHPNLENIKDKIRTARAAQVINHSVETKKKIGDAQRGDKGYWYGKSQSVESNKKRSVSMKGKPKPPRSAEHAKKLSEANKGKVPWNKGLKFK